MKKYIDIKLEGNIWNRSILISPDRVLFFAHFFGMFYDRASENMGHFYALVYKGKYRFTEENFECWGSSALMPRLDALEEKYNPDWVKDPLKILDNSD